jgi:hypothetical protein
MVSNSTLRQAIARVIATPATLNVLAPSLTTSSRIGSPRAAIRRCCAAWQRAFDAYLYKDEGLRANEYLAADHAGAAYRNAMPVLSGRDGIRNFIACAAHGILMGAIPENRGGQLLYAAQVAMASFQLGEKSPEKTVPPTPPVPEIPPSATATSIQVTYNQQHNQNDPCTNE